MADKRVSSRFAEIMV